MASGKVSETMRGSSAFMMRFICVSAVVPAFCVAFLPAPAKCDYVTVDVANAYRRFYNTNIAFRASTIKQTAYPSEIGTPMFWIDASDTGKLVVDEETKTVSKIVNKGSSSRYLTAAHDEIQVQNYALADGRYALWYGSLQRVAGPEFKDSDGTIKGPYLDFGETGTKRGLWFNAVSGAEGAALSNRLHNIGSVIGVYKSHNGGGQLLGGEQWRRYSVSTDQGTNRTDSIMRYGAPPSAVYNGTFWHGRQRHAAETSYWPKDWAVIALNPTAATQYAEGVGCGYCENVDAGSSCGGQAIAELLIFDRSLTAEESEKVVAYLENKWLIPAPGWNGNAQISWISVGGAASGASGDAAYSSPMAGIGIPVDVPQDERLTICRLHGGRALPEKPHTLEKTGAGTLFIGDGRQFGGVVEVGAGVLELGGKPIPAFESLPDGAAIHFDASDTGTMEMTEDGLVSSIANLGENLCAVAQTEASKKPKLVRNSPLQGLNLLDFGFRSQTEGRCLAFSAEPMVATVVAVVDARFAAGGNLFDKMFRRPTDWLGNFADYRTTAILGNASVSVNNHTSLNPRDSKSKVWVNGLEIDYTEGYDTPGLSVVAYRVPACSVTVLGGRTQSDCGGIRIGEVIAWRETLTDEEIRDVQAYLAKKWLGRTLSGYADESGVPDLQWVRCKDGVVLNVPSGRVATVGMLESYGDFRKTGGGTLNVQHLAATNYNITVEEGRIEIVAGPDVEDDCSIAAGPSLHLDPSRADLVNTCCVNGTNFILSVQDPSGRAVGMLNYSAAEKLYGNAAVDYTIPWIASGPDECCNGLSVIDFGEQASSWDNTKGASLYTSASVKNTRAVFMVYNSDAGGGQPLGWKGGGVSLDTYLAVDGAMRLDFYRANPIATGVSPLFGASAENVTSGELFINGERQSAVKSYIPKGDWALVELHTGSGAQFNCFGNAFQYYCHGGFKLGEVIVYERPLTERERVATRNYLLKKWFGKTDGELAELPEATVPDTTVKLMDINVAEGESKAFSGNVQTLAVKGDGVVELETGTLSVVDISSFGGSLRVGTGATLELSGPAPYAAPSLVEQGRILHLDATSGVVTETNQETKAVSVKEWKSLLADGWSAMPGPVGTLATTNLPVLIQRDLMANDILFMKNKSYMMFCKDGVSKSLDGIQSAFWVIGSQEGGGYLFGGGAADGIGWHRGGDGNGSYAADPLFRGAAMDSVEFGTWRINGNLIEAPRSTGLSGGYDSLSFVMQSGGSPVPNADGLAYDGRYTSGLEGYYSSRLGNQRLGELIVYNRMLSPSEVARTEAYLQKKWGFSRGSDENAATVFLDAGATLNCVAPQYVDTLLGTGDVIGDVAVRNLVADWEMDGFSVSGTLSVAENATVELKNLPRCIENGSEIVIVRSADEISGQANLRNAEIIGETPSRKLKIKVKVGDGKVSVKFMPEGFWMILR